MDTGIEIVLTSNFRENESAENLFFKLEEGINRVHQWGIDPEILAQSSILTPACGMGTMKTEEAKRGLNLLSVLSKKCSSIL